MLHTGNMAKYLYFRGKCLIKHKNNPLINITRGSTLPSALPIPDKPANDLLRNLRVAVSPSYGQGTNSYAKNTTCSANTSSSTLAGDPKRMSNIQDIRSEILEKWNKRPQPDIHKEWLKNIMFN